MSPRAVVRVAREVLLTSGAVLGVLCLLLTAAGTVAGVKPLVFRSGSMSPAIHTGDLGMSRTVDASTLHRGDIVSVVASGGERVTHRVVNVASQGDARQLTLRGDANRNPDREVYTVVTAEKVLFHVPKAGYVVNAATSPVGVFVLGLYVAGLLALVLRRQPPDDGDGSAAAPPRPRGGSRRAEKPLRSRAASRTAVVMAGLAGFGVVSPASATPWTNPVTVSGTTLSARTVPAPVVSCGTLSIGTTQLTWSAVSGATGYVLHYGSGGATTETVGAGTTSKTFSGLVTSGTFTVEAQINYGSTTWTSATSNAKSYTVLLIAVGICT